MKQLRDNMQKMVLPSLKETILNHFGVNFQNSLWAMLNMINLLRVEINIKIMLNFKTWEIKINYLLVIN